MATSLLACAWATQRPRRKITLKALFRPAVALLLVGLAAESLSIYPHYLAFFNGGGRAGRRSPLPARLQHRLGPGPEEIAGLYGSANRREAETYERPGKE